MFTARPFSSRALRGLLLPALMGLLSACSKGPPDAGKGGGGMPPAAVTYQTIQLRDVPVDFEYPGQTSGSREVEVRARVSGVIDKRLYTEGSLVQAGQLLFRIDATPFAAAAAMASANVNAAKARLQQAERDYNRLKLLLAAQLISQQAFDAAAANLDVAKAALEVARAQDKSAGIDLGYTEVRAPIQGMIGRALKVEGALTNAQSDSLLATIAQIDPMNVNFSLSEAERNQMRDEEKSGALKPPAQGYVVKLKTSDGQWLPQTGKLDFSDYKADANTGGYANRARFANPQGALTPGQFVRVVLSGATRPNSIAIPQRAVLDGPTGKFVYVVGAGKDGQPAAAPTPVVVGDWVRLSDAEPNGWLIKQGLKAGDKVVVDGVARIFFPFQPIAPMTPEEAAQAAQQPGAAKPDAPK